MTNFHFASKSCNKLAVNGENNNFNSFPHPAAPPFHTFSAQEDAKKVDNKKAKSNRQRSSKGRLEKGTLSLSLPSCHTSLRPRRTLLICQDSHWGQSLATLYSGAANFSIKQLPGLNKGGAGGAGGVAALANKLCIKS